MAIGQAQPMTNTQYTSFHHDEIAHLIEELHEQCVEPCVIIFKMREMCFNVWFTITNSR
jgi:hypothetical protein